MILKLHILVIHMRYFQFFYANSINKFKVWQCFKYISIWEKPHQSRSGSALKAGRWEVSGSIPGRACRPSRSEFFVVFFETRVYTGSDPLERPPRRALLVQAQVPQADNRP